MKTILVVDDDPDNLALFSKYLESDGYHVVTAVNGALALEAVAEARPDLLLLDVMMPELDGISVCERLKSDPETAFIPIILATALDGKRDRIRGLEAGADEFLSKPVNREELLVRARSLMRWQDSRNALENARMAGLRNTFNRYVSPKLVDTILANPDIAETTLQDKKARIEAVILFADLRQFTQASEALVPEKVVTLLNEFFALLTEAAHRYDGTIFNMAGDSLLVGYNVPLPQPDCAIRAIETAAMMQRVFKGRASEWLTRFGVQVGLGIGISSGEVIVGNIGSPSYMNYTVIGDTVNVASRLTGKAAPGEILVSTALNDSIATPPKGVSFEALEPITLKGKSEPQSIYRAKFEMS